MFKNELKEIRALLSKRESWTKNSMAKDKYGNYVTANDETACKWCLLGAVYKCTDSSCKARAVRGYVVDNLPGGSITAFNDNTSHGKLLAFLDKLIETEEPCGA